MQQKSLALITKNTIENINIYREAARYESIGTNGENSSMTVQFSPTQKKALQAILKEHNLKGSTFIREMVDTQLEILPYRDFHKRLVPHMAKMSKHEELIFNLLESLP